jgi:formylglycine-generating enzyme required for sulfatase activity
MGVNPSRFKGPQHPVESVKWDEAVRFCNELSALPDEKKEGRTYRLLTEAEWEYACRARSTTRYSFGESDLSLGEYAWFGDFLGSPSPVGQKRPNAWGLFDMHGNVCEWCADWFESEYYAKSPLDDPQGPPTGTARVYRGGDCHASGNCGSAARVGHGTDSPYDIVGFRVALDVTKKAEPPKEGK